MILLTALLLSGCQNTAADREGKFNVGDYVTFGTYPQTEAGDDATPIEWLVLARDGQKAFLISRYGLDTEPYNERGTSVTWETCTLRSWLNDEFLNRAFTVEEQAGIIETEVDNSESQGYREGDRNWHTSGGNNTRDRIFLLSYAEANKYLRVWLGAGNITKPRVSPTAYALRGTSPSDQDKTADGAASVSWWLRSPGYKQDEAAIVRSNGSLSSKYVTLWSGCIRPALWINLDSLPKPTATPTATPTSTPTSPPTKPPRTESRYSSDSAVGSRVFEDIVYVSPEHGVYSTERSTYSDLVCKCTNSSGGTVWICIDSSDYKKYIDPEANLLIYSTAPLGGAKHFSPAKRFHGTVERADGLVSGWSLSNKIGSSVIFVVKSIDD